MGGFHSHRQRAVIQSEQKMSGRAGRIKRRTLVLLATAAALPVGQSRAWGQNLYWKNSVLSGSFNVANNWSAVSSTGTDSGGVPSTPESAYLFNSDGLAHTINASSGLSVGALFIGSQGGGSDTLIQNYPGSSNIVYESIGVGNPGATGSDVQSAGSNDYNSYLSVGSASGTFGTYTLTNNAFVGVFEYNYSATPELTVGLDGTGLFNQSGGSVSLAANGSPVSAVLSIGTDFSARGTYLLSNTTGSSSLSVGTDEIVALSSPASSFNQSGGGQTIGGNLYVGENTGSGGSYFLSGGSLAMGTSSSANKVAEYIGFAGTGIFTQTGGTHTVGTSSANQPLYVGYNSSGVGTYVLSGVASTLTVNGNEFVGYNGSGTFNQSNGTQMVTNTVDVAFTGTGRGTFYLSGGTLNASQGVNIGGAGTGQFTQTGGNVIIGAPSQINSPNSGSGTYLLNGGTLSESNDIFMGGLGTCSIIQNAGIDNIGYQLNLGSGASGKTQYVLAGGTFNVGSALFASGGSGGGGSFYNQSGGTANLGELDFAIYSSSVGTGLLSNSSATLNVYGSEYVADAPSTAASFNQSGGTHTIVNSLYLGDGTGSNGTFYLSGGTLAVGTAANNYAYAQYIGYTGVGTFVQTAGSNTVGTANNPQSLYLGYNASGGGAYILNGSQASLTVNGNEYVGAGATGNSSSGTITRYGGSFVQVSGTHAVTQNLDIGNLSGATGSYNMTGGNLIVGTTGATDTSNLFVGDVGTGLFNQSGGTVTIGTPSVSQALVLAFQGSSGTYLLSGASSVLTINGNEQVGNAGPGGAVFNQSGGTQTIGTELQLGIATSGTFLLSGGTLTVGTEAPPLGLVAGNSGSPGIGTFIQTGGTSTLYSAGNDSSLLLGYAGGTVGTYSLAGPSAALNVVGNAYLGGSNSSGGGVGLLNISAGTATITGTLKIWNTAGSGVNLSSGGTLSVGALDTSGNPSLFLTGWTGGTLAVTGAGGLGIGSGNPLGSSLSISGGRTLAVTNVLVTNSGSTLTIGSAGTVTANSENFSVGTDTILQTGGSNTASFFYLGANPGAIGTYNQTGGTNTQAGMSIGNYPGGNGNYFLGGTGQLIANGNVYMGGIAASPAVGTLTITGGSAVVGGTLYLYNASGCAINISGGSLQVSVSDTAGVVNLQGGSLSTGTLITEGNPANFHFTGGSLTLTNSALTVGSAGQLGSVLNIGPSQSVATTSNFGESVSGSIAQTGGSNSISGNLAVGVGGVSGLYGMSGASLLNVGGTETIGGSGSGSFTESGGTNSVPILILASQFSSTGTYGMSGGNLNVTTGEYVGQGGNGIFNQTGGTQMLGELGIGTTPGGFGSVSLTNGTIGITGNVGVGGTPAAGGGVGQLTIGSAGTLSSPTGTFTVFDNPNNLVQVNAGGQLNVGNVALLGGITTIGAGGKLHDYGALTFGGSDSPVLYVNSDNANPGIVYLPANGSVTFTGTSGTAYINSNGSGSLPGMLDLGGGVTTFNVSAGSSPVALAIGATLVNGSVLKTSPGVLQLAGSNAFVGAAYPAIKVSAGTLQLGSSAPQSGFSYALGGAGSTTYISSAGGTLDLNGWNVSSASLVVGGFGVGNNGALINSSLNASTFGGPVTLSSGLVSIGGIGPITLSGPMTGSGRLLKTGFDTLTLSGLDMISGGIQISSGTLSLIGSNSFTGGILIDVGTLAVNSDQSLGDNSNSIVLNGNGTFEAAGTFSSSRTFNAAGGTISVDTGNVLTLSNGGKLIGNGSIYASGAGTLRLTSASTFSGSLVVSNGTFSLSNTSGALPNVGSIDLRTGGILELNSSTLQGGNQTSQDRIRDAAPIVLDGGSINLYGVDGGATTETVGGLNVASGSSTIQLNNGSGANASTTLTFASLFNRSTGATLSFNASNAGGNTLGSLNKVFFNSGVTAGQPLGGWATVNGTDFAKYNSAQGVVAFTPSDYSINTFATGANVYLDPTVTSPPVPANAGAGSLSIATLNLAANNNSIYGTLAVNQVAGTTLNISSGGLIKSGTNSATISGGILTSSSGELDVLVSGGTLTIGSQLSGNFVLTERGSGVLQLNGSANNNYTGVTLVSGTLQLNNTLGVSVPGNLIVNGGLVTSLADHQFNTSSNVIINSGEWDLHGHNESINSLAVYGGTMLFNHGALNVSSGVTLAGGTTIIASDLESQTFLSISGGANNVGAGALVTATSLSLNANPTGASTGALAVQVATNNTSGGLPQGILALNYSFGSPSILVTGPGTATLQSVGSGTIPGTLDLGRAASMVPLTINPSTTLVLNTQVTDGGLNVSGGGMVSLMTANNYSAGTMITGSSTVMAGNPLALGNSGSTVSFGNAGGTLELRSDTSSSGAVNFPYQLALTASSGVVDINFATQPASSNVSSSTLGTFNVSNMTLNAGQSLTLTGPGTGTLNIGNGSGAAVTLFSASGTGIASFHTTGANLTIDGQLQQSGGTVNVLKDGPYTMTLGGAGANNFGSTTVNGGTLVLAKPAGSLAVPGSLSIAGGSTVRFVGASNQVYQYSAVSLDSTLGACTLDLNGFSNTFNGLNITLGGTVTSATDAANGSAGLITLTGGVVFNGNVSGASSALLAGNLNLSSGSGLFTVSGTSQSMLNVSAGIIGTAGLTKAGPGILYLSSNANTFTGTINISGGTLEASSNASLGASTNPIILNGGTLLFANSFDPGSLSLPSTGTLDTGANTVSVGGNITGSGALTKLGTGTLILGGTNNNFTGGLVIYSGAVEAFTDANFGIGITAPLNLSGGTLIVPSNLATGRAFYISAASTINASTNISTGTLTLNNLYSLAAPLTIAGGTVNFNQSTAPLNRGNAVLLTINSGATVIDGGTFDALGSNVNVSNNSVTSFDVAGAAKNIGAITGSGNTNIAAGSLLTAYGIQQNALIINGSVSIANHTVSGFNRSGSLTAVYGLTLAGTMGAWTGKLDLSNNDAIIHNGSLAQLTDQIKSGYNQGKWNGASGIASSAAANDTTHLTALGVIQNSNGSTVLYGSGLPLGLFDGQNGVGTDVLVRYTYYGDTNLSGEVDATDYSRIDNGYLNHLTGWFNGDFNYDGVINGSDYTLMDNAFNTQGGIQAAEIADPIAVTSAQIQSPAVSAVPEPGSIGLLGVATLGLLGRGRRRGRPNRVV
jgi:autotransporter-associated beta strand protein